MILLPYSYKQSCPPADKCMSKVISDYTKNVTICINLDTVHREIIFEWEVVLEVLIFNMLPALVKQQTVDKNI